MSRLPSYLLPALTLIGFAAEAPVSAPSDPAARYYVLERQDSSESVTLLLRRVEPNGVSYSQASFACEKPQVSELRSFDNIQAARRDQSSYKRATVPEGSVAHDLWVEACITGRPRRYQELAALRKQSQARYAIKDRIAKLQPRRRETPMRGTNVTDREVGEIESAAAAIMPGAVVNIGTVVTGCPCEDGSSCSAQVWVVAYRPDKSTGLLLSRIDDRWIVGPVQQWWLDYKELYTRPGGLSVKDEYALTDRFPRCAAAG